MTNEELANGLVDAWDGAIPVYAIKAALDAAEERGRIKAMKEYIDNAPCECSPAAPTECLMCAYGMEIRARRQKEDRP